MGGNARARLGAHLLAADARGLLLQLATVDASRGEFVDALYLSLDTLGPIGFGDITPVYSWLRILTPVEALIGFGLLTGSISWLLSIYPALLRRRSLAYEVALLREAEKTRRLGVDDLPHEAADELYAELTSRLVAVERDLVTFPITYYFASADSRFALSSVMPYLLELARRGDQEGMPASLRLRATLLREAIDDFARTTSARFHGLRSDATDELLEAYKRDHLRSFEGEKVAYGATDVRESR